MVSAAKVRLSIGRNADRSLERNDRNCNATKFLNPGSCCIKRCYCCQKYFGFRFERRLT